MRLCHVWCKERFEKSMGENYAVYSGPPTGVYNNQELLGHRIKKKGKKVVRTVRKSVTGLFAGDQRKKELERLEQQRHRFESESN